jgi:ActR/RegA family two-component response regulator
MPALTEVLVVGGGPDLLALVRALDHRVFRITTSATAQEVATLLRHRAFHAVVVDLPLGTTDLEGNLDELRLLQAQAPLASFGVVGDAPLAERVLASGQIAFALSRPLSRDALIAALNACVASHAASADRVAAVRIYFSALERSAWDRLAALCAENVVYRLPADDTRIKAEIFGRAAFLAFARETFSRFPEPRYVIHSIREVEGGIRVDYSGTWRVHPQHRSSPLAGSIVFRFDHDQITEIEIRIDSRNDVITELQAPGR